MGVVDDEVVDEGTCTAFSMIEEQVGGDGGSRCSEEQKVGVRGRLVDDEEESLCQLEDGEGDGCRQRQALRARLGVLLAVGEALANSRQEGSEGDWGERVVQQHFVDGREVGLQAFCGHSSLLSQPCDVAGDVNGSHC